MSDGGYNFGVPEDDEDTAALYCTCDMPDGAGYCHVHDDDDPDFPEPDEDMTNEEIQSAWSRGELVVTPGVVEHSALDHLPDGLDATVTIPFDGNVIFNVSKRQIRYLLTLVSQTTGKDIFTLLKEADL